MVYQRKIAPDAGKQVRKTLFRTTVLGREIELNSVETESKMTFKCWVEVVGRLVNVIKPSAFANWHFMKLGS